MEPESEPESAGGLCEVPTLDSQDLLLEQQLDCDSLLEEFDLEEADVMLAFLGTHSEDSVEEDVPGTIAVFSDTDEELFTPIYNPGAPGASSAESLVQRFCW